MVRYLIELAYKGTNYKGWQIQPNGVTIQQKIEEALTLMLRQPINICGAGRTDSGVHATYMTAHFDAEESIDNIDSLISRLSKFLPPDIAIYNIIKVSNNFHSRFDALSRRYEYHIILKKDPFKTDLATRLFYRPDFGKMNQAAELLFEFSDFTSFCKLHSDTKNNLCSITDAKWLKVNSSHYYFTIEANRFLRDMVRAIVGTLLDVGRGRLSIEDFKKVIDSKNRAKASMSAPAKGLYLVDIKYPDSSFVVPD
ncbi:tRNA pseudouridine(38-40) synthase TruA [Marinilabiliaceae bacterium ANBcel2]|nr:tRNA pseudouridine(38-40) synthase TruA [Marinilabiliaceae bacterium ANBcel2]